jgi:flagellin
MALNVVSNFAANVAHRNLTMADTQATNSLAKLLLAEVVAMRTARVNTGQAGSMLQIADGAMGTISDILIRMKELATQSASDQLGATERGILNSEFTALRSEIDRIANDTEFNGVKLTQGGISGSGLTGFSVADGVESISGTGVTGTSTAETYTAATNIFSVTVGGVTYTGQIDASALNGGTGANALLTSTVVTLTNSSPTETGTITLQLNTAFDSTSNVAGGDITFTGSAGSTFTFKVGTGIVSTEDNLTFTVDGVTTSALSISASIISGATSSNANAAITAVANAIDTLNQSRSVVGAAQNRLSFAAQNLATAIENAEAARSTLLDLDVAAEITVFTSKQVLLQTGIAMLAQANQLPQNLLRLFQ